MKKIYIYFSIIILSLSLLELSSFMILEGYRSFFKRKSTDNIPKSAKTNEDSNKFTLPTALTKDQSKVKYGYSPFLGYKLHPLTSKFVNINENGIRLNGSELDESCVPGRLSTIWIFGSSALFGSPNLADDQTVASHLEKQLRENYGPCIQVINYGVHGYFAYQDALRFKSELLWSKPDVVVFFSGYNDFIRINSIKTLTPQTLFDNKIGDDQMRYYWNFHNDNGVISTVGLSRIITGIFKNTTLLSTYFQKFLALMWARQNPEKWKKEYFRKSVDGFKIQTGRQTLIQDYYLNELRSSALLAKAYGIKVILSLQPELFSMKKKRNSWEEMNFTYRKWSYFTDFGKEVDREDKIESYRVNKKVFLNLDKWIKDYRILAKSVEKLAGEVGAGYVDTQPSLDQDESNWIFFDGVHFTDTGSKIISLVLMQEIEVQLELASIHKQ